MCVCVLSLACLARMSSKIAPPDAKVRFIHCVLVLCLNVCVRCFVGVFSYLFNEISVFVVLVPRLYADHQGTNTTSSLFSKPFETDRHHRGGRCSLSPEEHGCLPLTCLTCLPSFFTQCFKSDRHYRGRSCSRRWSMAGRPAVQRHDHPQAWTGAAR